MQSKFYLIFNGESSDDIGISIVARPNIPSPKQKIKSYDIPGSDGTHTEILGYEDISIVVELNKKCKDNLNDYIRKINKWLYHVSDRKLIFSDNLGYYYRVKRVVVDDKTRTRIKYTRFNVTFICEAYQYTNEGQYELEISPSAQLINPYFESSLPVIKIYGEGYMKLNINDQVVEVNVGQSIIINSDKKLTYRDDSTMCNSSQKGDYPKLGPGVNQITIDKGTGRLDRLLIQTNFRTV